MSDNNEQAGSGTKASHAAWHRHFDGLADEIMRLTAICDIDLREPGVIERVLHGNDSDCGRKNAIAFKKLQKLLAATYNSVNKAVGRVGAQDTKAITAEIASRIDQHRAAGGRAKSKSDDPFRHG